MLHGEHSAILLTCFKLPFVIKIFVLSIFEWPLKSGFTVCCLTLCLLVSSADCLFKQFGPRSVQIKHRARSRSKLFDTLMAFLKEFFETVDFEKKSADNKKACKITQYAKS